MRPDSSTYLQYFGIELTALTTWPLYVPEMFAHGYQALEDGTEVLYQVSEFYTPGVEQGLRYERFCPGHQLAHASYCHLRKRPVLGLS